MTRPVIVPGEVVPGNAWNAPPLTEYSTLVTGLPPSLEMLKATVRSWFPGVTRIKDGVEGFSAWGLPDTAVDHGDSPTALRARIWMLYESPFTNGDGASPELSLVMR